MRFERISQCRYQLAPIKRLARVSTGEMPTFVADGPIPVLGANGEIGRTESSNHSGNIILVGRVGSTGAVNVARGNVWVSDNALVVEPNPADLFFEYAKYLFSLLALAEDSVATAQPLITQTQVRNRHIPVPTFEKQRAIADFLDRETVRIDALIAKKRQLMSVVSQRSAIEGDSLIWNNKDVSRMPLRHLAQFVDYRGRTPKKLGLDWGGGDIPAISAMNVEMGRLNLDKDVHYGSEELYRSWMSEGDVTEGDVLMTTEAPMGNVVQIQDDRRYILSQRVLLLKPYRTRVNGEYLAAALSCPSFQRELQANSTGSTALGIKVDRLKAFKIPAPSLDEQNLISSHLAITVARERAGVAMLTRQLGFLAEHRQALITAAVTGQLEIPSAA